MEYPLSPFTDSMSQSRFLDERASLLSSRLDKQLPPVVNIKVQAARISQLEKHNFDLKMRVDYLEKLLTTHGLGHLSKDAAHSRDESRVLELLNMVEQRDEVIRRASAHIVQLEDQLRAAGSASDANEVKPAEPATDLEGALVSDAIAMLDALEKRAVASEKDCDAKAVELDRQKAKIASLQAQVDQLEARILQILDNTASSPAKKHGSPPAAPAIAHMAPQPVPQPGANIRAADLEAVTARANRLAEHNRLLILELEEKRALVEFAKAEYDKLARVHAVANSSQENRTSNAAYVAASESKKDKGTRRVMFGEDVVAVEKPLQPGVQRGSGGKSSGL